jgi:hypothetical protein
VILTTARSSIDPHKDAQDTLLLNVSCTRWAWFAPPKAAQDRVILRSDALSGGPIFLPLTCDSTKIHSLSHSAANGVEWSPPVTAASRGRNLHPERLVALLLAKVGGVVIPIEIESGKVRGNAPRVFRHVGTRKPMSWSHCDWNVSRRAGWGSAASVLQLWTPALAVFEFQEANMEPITNASE